MGSMGESYVGDRLSSSFLLHSLKSVFCVDVVYECVKTIVNVAETSSITESCEVCESACRRIWFTSVVAVWLYSVVQFDPHNLTVFRSLLQKFSSSHSTI